MVYLEGFDLLELKRPAIARRSLVNQLDSCLSSRALSFDAEKTVVRDV